MSKKIRLIILIISIVCLVSCVNPIVNESIELGKEYLENFQYEDAKQAFSLAVQSGCKDKEIENLLSIISSYLECISLVKESKYEEAKTILSEVSIKYMNYSIKEDIEKLMISIDEGIEINKHINDIRNLVEYKKYNEAAKKINIVNNLNLDVNQVKVVDKIYQGVKLEIDKIKKEEEELVKREEENKKGNLTLKYRVNASEEETSGTFLEDGNGKIILTESDYSVVMPLKEGGKRVASNDTPNSYIIFNLCNKGTEPIINPVVKFKFNDMCVLFSEDDVWKGIERVGDLAMWSEIKWEPILGTNITNESPQEFKLNLANAAIDGYNPTIEISISAENFQEKTFILPVELK